MDGQLEGGERNDLFHITDVPRKKRSVHRRLARNTIHEKGVFVKRAYLQRASGWA